MPAGEHGVGGSGHAEVGGEEHPADGGELVDDGPQEGAEPGEGLADVGGVRGQPVEDGVVAGVPDLIDVPAATSRSKAQRMPAGEIDPKAAMTASGPAGARGVPRAAM